MDAALADHADPVRAIAALSGMLDQDLRRFAERMRSPRLVGDRWALLGELHELQGTCEQCLVAIGAAILRPWTDQPVESWLPDYASALTRVVRLRSRIVDLHAEATDLQAVLREDPGATSFIFGRLDELLRIFAVDPAYADMRPLDKHQLLQVRMYLLRGGPDWADGSTQLEDFIRSLEVMQDINRRPVLVDHDREKLGLAAMLLESDEPVDAVRESVEAVYGRWGPLDGMIRAWRNRTEPSPEELLEQVVGARRALDD